VQETPSPQVGSVTWFDLTVPDADRLRDFYAAVVGWRPQPVEMGGYADYSMTVPESGEAAAGICHHRGVNEGIPPQWMIYIRVAELDQSMAECRARGGAVLHGPRDMGSYGHICVIRDPAGAVAGLIGPRGRD
jgi:predicted enzyme related to lactoylglutathione lyase